MKRIAYLSLQATREGQASYAHVHEIIKGLQKLGWMVDLYEPRYASQEREPSLFQRVLEFIRVQLSLWMNGSPDVIYARWHFANWPTAMLARMKGVPIIQEINGPYEDLFIAWPWTRKFPRLFKWLMRIQLLWADAVIAVTPQLVKWAENQGGKNVFLIPNGANTELFHPNARLDGRLDLPKNYVVFFGALAPWQGISYILEAIKDTAWPSDVSLVIIGDGLERSKVEEAARDDRRIHYLGRQPYITMPGIVAKSIAGLSPQTNENGRASTGLFPLKVFETLASGVPVIVTNHPGMADLVRENGCGVIVPERDPEALAKAVRFLYENPVERERMGKIGRALVVKHHSWQSRALETAKVISSILNGDVL